MTNVLAGRLGYVAIALIVLAVVLGRLDWIVGVILWIVVVLLVGAASVDTRDELATRRQARVDGRHHDPGPAFPTFANLERITDRLADERGGDYTYDPTDAGYYAALDDVRAAAGLSATDRSRRS
jgi:hypothetical protein